MPPELPDGVPLDGAVRLRDGRAASATETPHSTDPSAMDEERRLAQRRAEERIGALLPRPGPRAAAVSVWWLLGL